MPQPLPPDHWHEPYRALIERAHLSPLQTLLDLIPTEQLRRLRGEGLSPGRWLMLTGTLADMAQARTGGAWETALSPNSRHPEQRELAAILTDLALSPEPTPEKNEGADLKRDGLHCPQATFILLQTAVILAPDETAKRLRRTLKRSERPAQLSRLHLALARRRPDLVLSGELQRHLAPLGVNHTTQLRALQSAMNGMPELSEEKAQTLLGMIWQNAPSPQEWQSERAQTPRGKRNATSPTEEHLILALTLTQHAALRLEPEQRQQAIPAWIWALRQGEGQDAPLWSKLNPGTSGQLDEVTSLWFKGDHRPPISFRSPRELREAIENRSELWARLNPPPGRRMNLQRAAELERDLSDENLQVLQRESNQRRSNVTLRCQRAWQVGNLTRWVTSALNDPDLTHLHADLEHKLNFLTLSELLRRLSEAEVLASGLSGRYANTPTSQLITEQQAREIAQATLPLAEVILQQITRQFTQARQAAELGKFEPYGPNFGLPEILLAQDWQRNLPDRSEKLLSILTQIILSTEETTDE